MSAILYYSNYCKYSKDLLVKLSRTKRKNDLHFVCIDKREQHKDGTTHVILENGQRLLLPPNVKKGNVDLGKLQQERNMDIKQKR
jgi:hypothetical protein